MLFWINLAMNCALFFVVINLAHRARHREKVQGLSGLLFFWPITLGSLLTVLDSMRLAFLQQIILFVAISALIYWLFSVFLKK